MLSNKYIYNIAPKQFLTDMMATIIPTLKIRRKIAIKNVVAVTISRLGYEFVIHVPSEYDYRYSSEKYILKKLMKILKN